jgi:shikimate dehydrogenase
MKRFGLIGQKLGHSFSQRYFTEKFAREGMSDHRYDLYELPQISALPALLANTTNLCGLNVTIPYKIEVMQYLDDIDEAAAAIGAVNVIKISPDGRLKGYNSDYDGFRTSLLQFLNGDLQLQALVLGKGGAARAVCHALHTLNIEYKVVSRKPDSQGLTYADLLPVHFRKHRLIVNATPVGMYPAVEECPPIDYASIGHSHYLYDLVYNPEETLFMQKGKAAGAKVLNGLPMLYGQAEKAWEIWQNA